MPQTKRAYALRDSFDLEDFEGSVAVGDLGKTLDVAGALRKGGGTYVTDNVLEIAALNSYPAVKTVAVPSNGGSTETKAELLKRARELDLDVSDRDTKAEIEAALSEAEGGS